MISFNASTTKPPTCERIKFSHDDTLFRNYYTGMYAPTHEWFAEGIQGPIKNIRSWGFINIIDERAFVRNLIFEQKRKPYFRISFIFAWYDLWIGFFWDKKKRWLYLSPIPTLGIILKFKK